MASELRIPDLERVTAVIQLVPSGWWAPIMWVPTVLTLQNSPLLLTLFNPLNLSPPRKDPEKVQKHREHNEGEDSSVKRKGHSLLGQK